MSCAYGCRCRVLRYRLPKTGMPGGLRVMRSGCFAHSLAVISFAGLSSDRAEDGDPNHGNFTLAEATKGLSGPASGPLQAVIETSKGKFPCELFAKPAPVHVASFLG